MSMKILLTGANGYIGTHLLPILVEAGHQIVAMVRNPQRLQIPKHLQEQIEIIQADLLDMQSLSNLPKDIDAACGQLANKN